MKIHLNSLIQLNVYGNNKWIIWGRHGKNVVKVYNKQVLHYLLTRAINKLVGKRIIGNNDSKLGTILDLRHALANNMLVKTEELELQAA